MTTSLLWMYCIDTEAFVFESSSSRKWYFPWLEMRPTNPFESCKNHTFHGVWSIILRSHNGTISKRHFKASCIALVQNILFLIPYYHKRAKTGLRPRFYLNCSHLCLTEAARTALLFIWFSPGFACYLLNGIMHCNYSFARRQLCLFDFEDEAIHFISQGNNFHYMTIAQWYIF